VRRRRDQELEGARNTRLRQVRAARCVIPYVLYGGLYCLGCRCCVLNGSLPPLIYLGGQGYMNPSPILAKESYPNIIQIVSFCTD
jgi:hypothetical protein